MTSGNLITSTGQAVLLDRGFIASPSYASPTIFCVGTGTATPGVGDVFLGTAIRRHASSWGVPNAVAANKLKDSTAHFDTWGVAVNDVVRCFAADTGVYTYGRVTVVDSATQLTLSWDMFTQTINRNYDVYFSKALVATYPSFDTGSNIATSRALLTTTECNGYDITEFGLFNVDIIPKLISHAVFPVISKTVSIQIIFIEKDTS
jgi:hypothetical protein